MTPNDIEFLLHCYCTADEHPRIDAPAVEGTINMFAEEDIITRYHGRDDLVWKTTPKGEALVKLLCSTPFPRQVFIDHHDNVINL